MKLSLACALLLDDRNRCLLVRKQNTDAFMQAGGKIEEFETPSEALKRELKEELSIDTDPESYKLLGSFTVTAANEVDTTIQAELFLVQLEENGDLVTPCAELEELVWLTPGCEPPTSLAPFTSKIVLPHWRELRANTSH